ncbi:MAG: Rne/Rng family ribonuclease [Janthinobacterium lividum]
MTKRMLIDSTHAEETRVVVLDGNRLEDYDIETSTKQQLKGNIYLAKIVRVEPSLQAAFVEFGGGRHGFLAFGEIHPDYYQIPVADRKRLLEMQEAEAREEEEEEEREAVRSEKRGSRRERPVAEIELSPAETELSPAETTAAIDAILVELNAGDDAGVSDALVSGDDAPDGAIAEAAATPSEPEGTSGDAGATQASFTEGFGEVDRSEPAAADTMVEMGYAIQADPEEAEVAMPRPDQVAEAAAVSGDITVAPSEAATLFPAEPALAAEPEILGAVPADDQAGPAPVLAEPMLAETILAETTPAELAPDDRGSVQQITESEAPELPESLGGEHDTEEQQDRRSTPRFLRNYKIQEVMRRRQILLVQVVKEERGTKGAALTTYISLAGRFSVLMPNSPRGGGISRKITSAADRRRLKEITAELDLPRGMGLIVRTAGANRPRPEIIRDCEYLLNQWDQIRDLTMKSMAPALIYEEASLIKRAIRDVYSREVDDILVDGEEGWRAAHDFMRMLMPTHAKKVQLWKDPQPLFAKAQVEKQLDDMLLPNVQLRSGGYLVINQTEALVAIDVNSGRSTRERGIEETALRTNLEAAEEAARQLRLRDLAGLIVIDFIDMESRRNNTAVEKKLKDALKNDRARIQIGSISHFGLLEMSRQRLRPSLAETSFVTCPACGGTGHVRGTESAALAVLRGIEDEGSKRRSAEIVVHVAGAVAFYILNHKRVRLGEIEARFGLVVSFSPDESMRAPDMRIERVRAQVASEGPVPISQLAPPEPFEDPDEEIIAEIPEPAEEEETEGSTEGETDRPNETAEEKERNKKRRRRRRGGRRDDATGQDGMGQEGAGQDGAGQDGEQTALDADGTQAQAPETDVTSAQDEAGAAAEAPSVTGEPGADAAADATGEDGERKRRGRRGGRRRRRDAPALEGTEAGEGDDAAETSEMPASVPAAMPMYVGPTPADPFGGSNAFDFFDAVEQAEQARASQPAMPEPRQPTPDASAETAPKVVPELAHEPAPELPLEAPAEIVEAPAVGQSEAEAPHAAPATLPADQPVQEPGAAAPVEARPTDIEPAAVAAEPAAAEPAVPEPVALEAAAPEPAAAEPTVQPAAEAVAAPPIAPVLIGSADNATGEKKRGWWRR